MAADYKDTVQRMELPWTATNTGEMVVTMAGALAHQRTPVQLLLFVCQNELNAPNIMENSVNRTRNGAHHAMIHTRSDVDMGRQS
uniref:Uncharacterized protein n=1 Tax=Oryza nivara TaxID=4536 RepID=A0A0E0GFQ7_ORYNI